MKHSFSPARNDARTKISLHAEFFANIEKRLAIQLTS